MKAQKVNSIVRSLFSQSKIRRYPTIEDFFLKDKPAIPISNEIEKKITANMEKLYEKHLIDEHRAIEESKHIFLNV